MTGGEDPGGVRLTVRCPHCGTLGEFRGRYRREMTVLCGGCKRDITDLVKKAFLRTVAAEIDARIVERENREFFRYLESAWRKGRGG